MQIITSIWRRGFSATSGGNVTGKKFGKQFGICK